MPTLRFDLIQAILEHGARFDPGNTVDPSTSPVLRDAGVAQVTAYIERLALIALVGEAAPMFGSMGGMWIGYQLTERGRELSTSEEALKQAVAELIGGSKTEVSDAIASLHAECVQAEINSVYRDDFLETLKEIGICFDDKCYMATIGLCGKALEVCLKEVLMRHHVQFDANAMIGGLIRSIKEHVPGEYLDPALGHVANIINTSRITAVHSHESIPIPSRDQAVMVIFATRDVVRRNLSHQPK